MSNDNVAVSGSEARLWKLVAERTRDGADSESIDRKIWDLFGERWAVLFTDLAGFSRRVASFGITHFLQIIYEQKQLLLPVVEEYGGVLIKSEADSFLMIFRRPESALHCAVAMQQLCRQVNDRRKPEEQILLCVGIGYGDILRIGDADVWGAEVNAASKLGEDTAEAYEILVTERAREAIGGIKTASFEQLKSTAAGVGLAYRLVEDSVGPT